MLWPSAFSLNREKPISSEESSNQNLHGRSKDEEQSLKSLMQADEKIQADLEIK